MADDPQAVTSPQTATPPPPATDDSQQLSYMAPPAALTLAPIQHPFPGDDQIATIPSQLTSTIPSDPVQHHMSWLGRILDSVGSILGGDTTYRLTKAADGTMSIAPETSTMGEKWGRVAAAALGGLAAGLPQSFGPAGVAGGASAGFQAGFQQPQQQMKQQEQAIDFQNKQLLAKANRIHLTQQAYMLAQQAKFNDLQMNQQSADSLAKYLTTLRSSPNAMDLGPIDPSDPNAAMNAARENPAAMDGLLGKNNKVLQPVIAPDHKIHLIVTDAGWNDQTTTKPMPILEIGKDDKGAPTLTSTTNAPAGTKVADLTAYNLAQQTKYYGFLKGYADAQKALREPATPAGTEFDRFYETWRRDNNAPNTAANELKARKLFSIAGSVREGAGGGEGGGAGAGGGNPNASLQTNAQMMVDGLAAPSQLSKRAKDYNAMLPMAQAYSLQKYNEPFDAEISEARYKARQQVLREFAGGRQADQIQSGQTFLNHAQDALDNFNNLRNSDVSLFNTPINKLRRETGNPAVAAVLPDIAAVRREYENFLSNNMALKGDEIREGHEMLNEDMSPAQFEAAMKAFSRTAIGRMSSLNNRALRFQVPIGGDLLTPRNMQTLANMGLGDYASQLIQQQPRSPRMFGQQPQVPQQQQNQQQQQQPMRGTRSISDVRRLVPQFKNSTDDEIRQALTQQRYNVVP